MLFVVGWAVAQAALPREASLPSGSLQLSGEEADALDREWERANDDLLSRLEGFLSAFSPPDLDWHFQRRLNYESGVLLYSSARNHRGSKPSAIAVLEWLAQQAPASYGLAYVHDDEDGGSGAVLRGRTGIDHTEEFRVWRLGNGRVDELDDPFFKKQFPR